jgi:uncharacterized protein YbjQ (UPF0145 family)
VTVSGDRSDEQAEPEARLLRLGRLADVRSWSFLGPVGGFGAASIAGFDPVGQVFGTTVAYLGPVAYDPCFVTARGSVMRGGGRSSADPYNPLLARVYAARKVALERAVAECEALGGDGIVGARMSCGGFFSGTVEVTVEGTAVRARSRSRAAAPFTTHVGGQDLAKLLEAGWMPFGLVFGLGIASCHFDPSMFQETRRGVGAAGNREVSGYTRVVNDARREARRALEIAVGDQGGQGAVVGGMTMRFSERECPSMEERLDYVVEATVVGSAIVSFERSAPSVQRAPLAIMRLDRRAEVISGEERGAGATAGPSLGDRAVAYRSGRGEGQQGQGQGQTGGSLD